MISSEENPYPILNLTGEFKVKCDISDNLFTEGTVRQGSFYQKYFCTTAHAHFRSFFCIFSARKNANFAAKPPHTLSVGAVPFQFRNYFFENATSSDDL
jgi:hypothetical protein